MTQNPDAQPTIIFIGYKRLKFTGLSTRNWETKINILHDRLVCRRIEDRNRCRSGPLHRPG